MKRTIILFLIFTGTLIFCNSQNNYYISHLNSTNLHSNRTAPPTTGIPEKREPGIIESNFEIY